LMNKKQTLRYYYLNEEYVTRILLFEHIFEHKEDIGLTPI
jgi:hypothetical protein